MAFEPRSLLKFRLIVPAVGLLALCILAYWFRGHLFSAFGWLTELTGNKTLAVLCAVLMVFLAGCAFFWLIFPIIVLFGLWDLRRRTAALEQMGERYSGWLAAKDTAPRGQGTPRNPVDR